MAAAVLWVVARGGCEGLPSLGLADVARWTCRLVVPWPPTLFL